MVTVPPGVPATVGVGVGVGDGDGVGLGVVSTTSSGEGVGRSEVGLYSGVPSTVIAPAIRAARITASRIKSRFGKGD